MTSFLGAAALAIAGVLLEDALPGKPLYHYGWYNALLIAILVYAALRLFGLTKMHPAKATALGAVFFGSCVIVFAGVASGLLAPDTFTVVGAPGASVASTDAGGTFAFPLPQNDASQRIVLRRGSSATGVVSGRRTFSGGFVMWQLPREVVYVEAQDARGNHLTITQPDNGTFLSPVLLMQSRTSIAGMSVPVDTFALPAVSRFVKVVLFTPQQAAQLHATQPITGSYAVLFAVSDANDRMLPHGISVSKAGSVQILAGVRLRAAVAAYPAVVVAAAPYLPALIAGLAIVVFGAGSLAFKSSSRS